MAYTEIPSIIAEPFSLTNNHWCDEQQLQLLKIFYDCVMTAEDSLLEFWKFG